MALTLSTEVDVLAESPVKPPSLLLQLRRTLRSVPVMAAIIVLSVIILIAVFAPVLGTTDPNLLDPGERLKGISEIGRASCRERVCVPV